MQKPSLPVSLPLSATHRLKYTARGSKIFCISTGIAYLKKKARGGKGRETRKERKRQERRKRKKERKKKARF